MGIAKLLEGIDDLRAMFKQGSECNGFDFDAGDGVVVLDAQLPQPQAAQVGLGALHLRKRFERDRGAIGNTGGQAHRGGFIPVRVQAFSMVDNSQPVGVNTPS